jgi:hypothetical protein
MRARRSASVLVYLGRMELFFISTKNNPPAAFVCVLENPNNRRIPPAN